MKAIVFQLISNLLNRKSIQISLMIVIIAIGVFATLSYQSFLYLQAQNMSQLSLFNEVIKPLSGLALLGQLFLASMIASQLTPYLIDRGQQGIFLHSAFSNSLLLWINLLVVTAFSLIPFGYFCLISFSYYQISDIDSGLIISTCFALLGGNFLFGLIILSVTLPIKKTLTALVISLGIIILFFALDELLRNQESTKSLSLFLNVFIHLRDGLIISDEVTSLILWVLFFYSILLIAIGRSRLKIDKLGKFLLFVSMLAILGHWLAPNYRLENILTDNKTTKKWDLSREKLNSLSNQMTRQIADIKAPIVITAVIDDEKNHDEIRQAFEVIRQYHPETHLNFSSRQSLINQSSMVDQFVSVQIAESQQSLRYPFDRTAKDAIAQLILQLTTRSNQWITFIEGHDEATPFGNSGRDIGLFFQSLKQLGWPVAMQNLSKQPIISQNTKVIVIADSKKQWLVGELNGLMNFLKQGGNLLLLREAKDQLPDELLAFLAIKTVPGTLIDWQGYQSGTPHPAILIVNQFNDHPVTTGINSLIAFPWSQGLKVERQNQKDNMHYRTIIQTHKGVWSEFNSEEIELAFDPDIGELQQVFDLAYSIKNENNGQRIIVVGDSSFLSDSSINNYANQQLALNLISWLSSQSFEIQQKKNRDSFVRASPIIHLMMNWLFSLVLPLLFACLMLVRCVKNRRPVSKNFYQNLNLDQNNKTGSSDE